MDNSPDSQPALIWNSVSINNCMWTHTPGRYLLRKSDWKDPKYYTSLTGIWDRSCGRIKLYVTDKEQFLTYDQVQMSKRVTENCEHIKRKGLVQKLKQKSVWYNNLVDSVAVMSLNSRMKKMAVEDYKDVVSNTMDQVNGVIISGYDSFALVSALWDYLVLNERLWITLYQLKFH